MYLLWWNKCGVLVLVCAKKGALLNTFALSAHTEGGSPIGDNKHPAADTKRCQPTCGCD